MSSVNCQLRYQLSIKSTWGNTQGHRRNHSIVYNYIHKLEATKVFRIANEVSGLVGLDQICWRAKYRDLKAMRNLLAKWAVKFEKLQWIAVHLQQRIAKQQNHNYNQLAKWVIKFTNLQTRH